MWAAGEPKLRAGDGQSLMVSDENAPGGFRAPRAGEIFRNPDLAATLVEIANGGKAAFYGGRVGRAIVDKLVSTGSTRDRRAGRESRCSLEAPFLFVELKTFSPRHLHRPRYECGVRSALVAG